MNIVSNSQPLHLCTLEVCAVSIQMYATNIQSVTVQTNSKPALPILLISTSRAILRLNCKVISHIVSESKSILSAAAQSANQAQAAMLSRSYKELGSVLAKSLVDLSKADRLLGTIDSAIKAVYQPAGPANVNGATSNSAKRPPPPLPNEERVRIEQDLLIRGVIPEILVSGVVRHLLKTTVETFQEELDEAELYFADVGWLGLTLPPPPSALSSHTANAHSLAIKPLTKPLEPHHHQSHRPNIIVDAVRKTLVRRPSNDADPTIASDDHQAPRLRRCIRCCAMMEDIIPQRGLSMIVGGLQRECFCGGRWMLLDREEEESSDENIQMNGNGNAITNGNVTGNGVGPEGTGFVTTVGTTALNNGNQGLSTGILDTEMVG